MPLRLLAASLLLVAAAFAGPAPAVAQPPPGSARCAGVGPPQGVEGARAVTYAQASGRDLRLYVVPAVGGGPPRAAALFFYGGGWRQGDPTAFAEQAHALAAHGVTSLLADYRVSCRDGTTPADAVDDARAAYAWMRAHAAELRVSPHRLVLAGGSAGGQMALVAALKAAPGEEAAALLLFNPAVDMVAFARPLGMDPAAAAAISPSVLPLDRMPPAVVFHGEADHTVPIATARAFCDRAQAAGRTCELHAYAGQDHGFFHSHAVDPATARPPYDDTLARSLAFLQRLGLAD